jgi:hypothetical protein
MRKQNRLLWLTALGGGLILVVLVLGLCTPKFAGVGPSKTSRIANNLRQLDAAKHQWAIENGKTGAVVVTEQDVAPYLRSFESAAGERYNLRTLPESPEVRLTRDVEGKPKGSVLRPNTNGTIDVTLPKSLH